jgi:hypothetical protein
MCVKGGALSSSYADEVSKTRANRWEFPVGVITAYSANLF